ncbi:MAG: hypothetical protein IJ880_00450 [Bacilli bacterium]|nr:hypothetical protein [Bacilli bacterium]
MALYANIRGSVNYTTVGSPTIENGIVSGFSSSDYLNTSSSLNINNFKGKIRAKLNSGNSGYRGITYIGSSAKHFTIEDEGTSHIRIYYYNSQTSSNTPISFWNKSQINGNYVDYFFEYDKNNNQLKFKVLDLQGNNIVAEQTYDNVEFPDTIPIKLGYVWQAFNGEIDLNETYINVNDTAWFGTSFSKVKLHSPTAIAYTKKGNPTITEDGIASGFTDKNDYLILGAFNPNTHKWRFTTKVKFNSLTANMSLIDRNSSTRCFQIAMRTNGKWRVNISINGSSKANEVDGTNVCTVDTIYYLRFEYDGSKYYLKISTDNINWTTDITINRADKIYPVSTMCMGHSWYSSGTEKWDGDIYMRYTRFEIDGVTNDKCVLHCLEGN